MAEELVHPSFRYIPNICYKNKVRNGHSNLNNKIKFTFICSYPQYLSIRKIGKSAVPFLFVSGLADTLVPPRMMRALFTKCGSEQKRVLEFIGGSHNDTWVVEGYYQGLKGFLNECQSINSGISIAKTAFQK